MCLNPAYLCNQKKHSTRLCDTMFQNKKPGADEIVCIFDRSETGVTCKNHIYDEPSLT